MAQFTHSLCEEVIRTDGRCTLSPNERVQMARLALRALKNENPLLADALRYRWLRENGDQGIYVIRRGGWKQGDPHHPLDLCQSGELDTVIDEYMSGVRKVQRDETAREDKP